MRKGPAVKWFRNPRHPEATMKRQKLTEAEERRLGEAIAAEARALGFVGKEKNAEGNKAPHPGTGT